VSTMAASDRMRCFAILGFLDPDELSLFASGRASEPMNGPL
jgi:hypothetical protein